MNVKVKQYQFYSKMLFVLTIAMIGLLLSSFIFFSYKKSLANAEKYELERLSSIAKTVALQIDGDRHEALICRIADKDGILENKKDKDYQSIYKTLKKAQEINDLESPIYTLFTANVCMESNKKDSTFLLGVTSANPYFRHPYVNAPKILQTHFTKGATIKEYYTDKGHWLSAFYPIKNKSNNIIAVVHVDQIFCGFVQNARMNIINDGIFALCLFLVLSLAFFYIYHFILYSMRDINDMLNETVEQRTNELKETNAVLSGLNERLENIVSTRTNELMDTNEQLKISNKKLKSFAHIASHDLKAPLRIINSFAQLLERKYEKILDKEGKEYLNFITSNSVKMSDLISDILSTSKLAHENKKTIISVDLNEVVKNVLDNLRTDISEKNAQIHYKTLPKIKGYRNEFLQLIQNLVSNSIKYSRQNIPPLIKITGRKTSDGYCLTIKDNGKGISDQAMNEIFTEFNRGDAKDDQGHGIGLATCQRIIAEYNGSMTVQSDVNQGSTFTCIFKDRISKNSSKVSSASMAGNLI